jgi:hypothetical protein
MAVRFGSRRGAGSGVLGRGDVVGWRGRWVWRYRWWMDRAEFPSDWMSHGPQCLRPSSTSLPGEFTACVISALSKI